MLLYSRRMFKTTETNIWSSEDIFRAVCPRRRSLQQHLLGHRKCSRSYTKLSSIHNHTFYELKANLHYIFFLPTDCFEVFWFTVSLNIQCHAHRCFCGIAVKIISFSSILIQIMCFGDKKKIQTYDQVLHTKKFEYVIIQI